MAQLMPLPLTVSCLSEIQIGFTLLVLAHPGSPGKRAVKQVCVSVCVLYKLCFHNHNVVRLLSYVNMCACCVFSTNLLTYLHCS